MVVSHATGLEQKVESWRGRVVARGASVERADALEDQLRGHLTALADSGLDAEERFLVALRRIAAGDEVTREYSIEVYGEALSAPDVRADSRGQGSVSAAPSFSTEMWVALACATAAAVAIKVPLLFGLEFDGDGGSFYARNLSLFVLPFLALYFAWKRGAGVRIVAPVAGIFVAAAVFANAYPFVPEGMTEILTALHLPIVLWLVVGVVHANGAWREDARRMEYVRFTGEWLVTYALIALGGGVLVALTLGLFGAVGIDVEAFVSEWVLPCGAAGAVVVAGWLVETRRKLVGGMAPMLARVFTPLFAVMLVAALGGVVSTRGVIDVERDVLILFDLLLVVVLALLLYALSSRDAHAKAGPFDVLQVVLVVCALAVDVFALIAIGGRLAEFGFSANKTAALGLNLILLANLAWSVVLQVGFVRARRGFEAVEHWQTRYLPVYALWAAIVVVAFPVLFAFA